MKKILLIGGSGYIGKNINEYLRSYPLKYQVYSPTSIELDVTDEARVKEVLEENYYDVVIHSAVHNSSTKIYKDNAQLLNYSLKMFYSFEKNYKLFGKMLYFGSGAEFNKEYDIKDVNEEMFGKSIPKDDYGFAKYIIAKQIENNTNIYNLRLFGVFGKYEHWKSKFISNACCKIIKGIPISIRQNVYFDYLWIDDLCKIVQWFINNKPKYKTYNIATGKKIDLLTLAKKINKYCDKELPIYVCKDGLANEYTADNKKLLSEIKDFDFTNIDIAINDIYKWYKYNESEIDIYSLIYNT